MKHRFLPVGALCAHSPFPTFLVCLSLLWPAWASLAQLPGTKRWLAPTAGHVFSSPAIAEDGTLYVGTGSDLDSDPRGWLYSFSPTGATNWVLGFARHIHSSPAIGADGRIYVGCLNGELLIVTEAGEYQAVPTGGCIQSSPAVGADGTIYVVSFTNDFNRLYAISPAGITNWVFTMGAVAITDPESPGEQFPSPAIGPDGTIYLASLDKNLYSISPTGGSNWMFSLAGMSSPQVGASYGSPAIGPDGTIYIGSEGGWLYALDPRGTEKWHYASGAIIESSPVVGMDGTIYFACLSGAGLFAIAPDGNKLWNVPLQGISASPALGADGTIYAATWNSQQLLSFNAQGSNLWNFSSVRGLPDALFSSPAIGPDGTIYFGSGKALFAVYGTGAGLMNSAWPMFRGNPKHTARAVQRRILNPNLIAGSKIALSVITEPGKSYTIDYSSNLVEWNALTNFVSTGCTNEIIDSAAPGSSARYYLLRGPKP